MSSTSRSCCQDRRRAEAVPKAALDCDVQGR
jgi:hypothetical protein